MNWKDKVVLGVAVVVVAGVIVTLVAPKVVAGAASGAALGVGVVAGKYALGFLPVVI